MIGATPLPSTTVGFTGAGNYTFTFLTFEEEDLVVYVTSLAGAQTDLVLNTDYTVTLVDGVTGGTVVVSYSGASSGTITINRVLTLEQAVKQVK